MEEIYGTLALPFMLGNLIYNELVNWISGDTLNQECDDLISLVGDGLLDNLCSQSLARDGSNICVQRPIALEANSVSNSPTSMDIERNIECTGDHSTVAVKASGASTQILIELGSVPAWGLTSICGNREAMEDAVVALPNFLRIPTQMLISEPVSIDVCQELSHITAHFFGVYDGHGGPQVANYCRDRLHLALAEEIEIAKEDYCNGSVGDNWQEQWEKTVLSCFTKVDSEVRGVHTGNGDNVNTGSTAVVAIISPTHIIVANCGDSRAVLCRGKRPVPLSVDHKPNREDELARIEAAGGWVVQWGGFRVAGVLAMSRSIGDSYLEPYVIPDPEMMFVPRAREDECLILASDGIWDVLTNEEVCDIARRRILRWYKKNGAAILSAEGSVGVVPAAQDAADYLSRLALLRGSRDNISVIVVDLKAKRKIKRKN